MSCFAHHHIKQWQFSAPSGYNIAKTIGDLPEKEMEAA
jgi:hypothetical protein